MKMTNPNENAFPEVPGGFTGLTKREYFAAMAMQGVMTGPDYKHVDSASKVAEWAVAQADALINELNKPK